MRYNTRLLLLFLLCPVSLFAQSEYAGRFDYYECDCGTILTVKDAWPGAEELRYALVPADSPAPEGDFAAVIRTPVQRVISLSTTYLPHIRDLGQLNRLIAVDSGAFVYAPEVRSRIEAGMIAEVGSPPALNIEQVITLHPDLVVLPVLSPDDPIRETFERAGIPVLVNADWQENGPLGRAEWIKVFGLLFERSGQAEARFARLVEDYRDLSERVAAVSGRPAVLVNTPYRGTWAVPAGESYMARLLRDAGADYLWADTEGTGSIFLDIERVVADGLEAEYWINLGYGWRSREDALAADPRFSRLPVCRDNQMYHYNRRVNDTGGNDFWESGASRPDLVLADLIAIFHPSLLPDHKGVYYRRLDP